MIINRWILWYARMVLFHHFKMPSFLNTLIPNRNPYIKLTSFVTLVEFFGALVTSGVPSCLVTGGLSGCLATGGVSGCLVTGDTGFLVTGTVLFVALLVWVSSKD